VLVAKDGNVIFNKAYGNHTYDGHRPTRTEDIFDLASITKVAATTPSAMRLCEEGK
jgi:CubicO group peptidase (beta-lactamase class C family)